MPDGGGAECVACGQQHAVIILCKKMRETSPQLPILILTALGEEHSRVKGLQAGADDYLGKPFNLEEFLLRVSGMLRPSSPMQVTR